MKKILFILLIILLVILGPAKTQTILDELIRPSAIYVDAGRVYIVDFPSIYIYSEKDLALIKKFGGEGAGPAEFLRFARLHFHTDHIIVQSSGRFTYFSRQGKYIREEKVPVKFDRGVRLFDGKLVVSHMDPGKENEKELNLTVNIYNLDFHREKEIFRQKYYIQLNFPVNAIYLPQVDRRTGIRFAVNQDKIFIEGEDGETGSIYVFNRDGEPVYTIRHEFDRLMVTEEHVRAAEEWFKMKGRRLFSILKQRKQLFTPKYFAAVRYLRMADNKIYIIPYKKESGTSRLYIFDLKGKLLKKVPVPVKEENLFHFYPLTIKGDRLYQLVDNDEEWELHISPIR